jgi:hypothetical protein
MVKRHNLATRAFGAEPGLPDVAGLAAWIAGHRGMNADIVTYQLDRSLVPQLGAGIMLPCAGGKFYADRIRQCMSGIDSNRAVGELHVDMSEIIEDAAGIVVRNKGTWCAIPAPHVLGITDTYYDDKDEWSDAICSAYRTIMRGMRDTGIAGHVLMAECIDNAELAALSRQKVFFFLQKPDRESLAHLLEHQYQIAVEKDHLQTLFDLMMEFTVRKVFILDPDPASIKFALSHLDPDQVVAGGYCTNGNESYWQDLVAAAVYTA